MRFCPWDGTLLIVDQSGQDGTFRFRCVSCPYVDRIPTNKPVQIREKREVKVVDDVLGGEAAWKGVSKTDEPCPKCPNGEAYFIEFQTRSADEPMTIFFKCTSCGEQWKR
mmetsp:Transcript_5128/g.9202  ORF Transcript_5128/g.9202 Transcript_5128/m.9202 type:complete len:110 (-) Transcript_5128:2401-2730(-)